MNGKTISPIDQPPNSSRSTSFPHLSLQRSISTPVKPLNKSNLQVRQQASNGSGSKDIVNPFVRSYTSPAVLSSNSGSANLAPILFSVVIVFVICNSLRVILNIYDSAVVEEIIECEKSNMGRYSPAWIMCTISVSHLLLMANSSVNFLVYCVAGKRFRSTLARKTRTLMGI